MTTKFGITCGGSRSPSVRVARAAWLCDTVVIASAFESHRASRRRVAGSAPLDADVGAVQRDDQAGRVAPHPLAHGRGDLREGQRVVEVQDVEPRGDGQLREPLCQRVDVGRRPVGVQPVPGGARRAVDAVEGDARREPGRAQRRSTREEVHPVAAQRELLRQVQRDPHAAAEPGVADDADR